jgi:hypothetical protein
MKAYCGILIISVFALQTAIGQKTADTPNLPPIRMKATVESGDHALRNDGKGDYVDETDSVRVGANQAFGIAVWKFIDLISNRPDPTATAPRIRTLIFDLDHPAGSGAERLGVITDELARFHVFWKHDHSDDPKVREYIHRFEEVGPIGRAEKSSRVEMWVRVKGRQHVLQMGPWAMGEFSPRAKLSGEGTSEAEIKRTSDNSWTIAGPKRSLARLWDYQDITHPIDKGLYYFDFQVVCTKLEDKPTRK